MNNWNDLTRSYSVWDESNIKGFFGEYRWLSNFHESPVRFEEGTFSSSEAAYQAAKCALGDEFDRFQHMSPKEAKNAGQKILLRADWELVKFDVMAQVVLDKFWRDPELRQKLLDTGDKYLEETNHWNDTTWGVDYKTGRGRNALGKILMNVREFLKAQIEV